MIIFFFVQFILKNANDNVPFGSNAMSAQIFQYAPVLIALAAAPLIYKGYELFKGKEGSGKFLIIMFTGFFVTEIAILLGFIFSLVLVVSEYDVSNIFALVFRFLRPSEGYITFRRAFYIYLVVGGILSFVSLIFPFSSKKEQDKANASTFDKLD